MTKTTQFKLHHFLKENNIEYCKICIFKEMESISDLCLCLHLLLHPSIC